MLAKRNGRSWYQWYAETDTPQERKLIFKLDLLIVPYAFVGFWINYIDSSNISELLNQTLTLKKKNKRLNLVNQDNAWVAGLSDDLNFHGNQLVQFQTINQVGSVIGQIPFAFLFPLCPMNWLIPGMEFLWGIFTLLQYRATTYSELMAYRFFIGLFEVFLFYYLSDLVGF